MREISLLLTKMHRPSILWQWYCTRSCILHLLKIKIKNYRYFILDSTQMCLKLMLVWARTRKSKTVLFLSQVYWILSQELKVFSNYFFYFNPSSSSSASWVFSVRLSSSSPPPRVWRWPGPSRWGSPRCDTGSTCRGWYDRGHGMSSYASLGHGSPENIHWFIILQWCTILSVAPV